MQGKSMPRGFYIGTFAERGYICMAWQRPDSASEWSLFPLGPWLFFLHSTLS